jgi:hypothetical protein
MLMDCLNELDLITRASTLLKVLHSSLFLLFHHQHYLIVISLLCPGIGDFANLQCMAACKASNRRVIPSKPVVDKLRPHIDVRTQTIPANLVPRCEYCGAMV